MTVTDDTREQRAVLVEGIRRLLARHSGPRPFLADGDRPATCDPALWSTLSGQVGISGLAVPEPLGGGGGAYADLCAVLEQLGRALVPVPVLSTVGMATSLLLLAGTPRRRTSSSGSLWATRSPPLPGRTLPEPSRDKGGRPCKQTLGR